MPASRSLAEQADGEAASSHVIMPARHHQSQTISVAAIDSNGRPSAAAAAAAAAAAGDAAVAGASVAVAEKSAFQAFLEAENTHLLDLDGDYYDGDGDDVAGTAGHRSPRLPRRRNCLRRIAKTNVCAHALRRNGLLFADDALEQEYELDFMRSERNYRFLGYAGGINLSYTIYLMTTPLLGRLNGLSKYAAVFADPDNLILFFSVHAVVHGVIQLVLNACLLLLALLSARHHRLRLLRTFPVVAFLWLCSLTMLFVEVELSNLYDWQSGLANITLGNINTSTFTPFVTVLSCGQNLTNGVHVRDDGCTYTFESMSKFALVYGWTSGSTNSELFICNIWVRESFDDGHQQRSLSPCRSPVETHHTRLSANLLRGLYAPACVSAVRATVVCFVVCSRPWQP
jgi:hypothetical protein